MTKMSRRTVIRSGLAAGALLAATSCKRQSASSGPTVITNSIKDVTLRMIGTGAAQINDIKEKAEQELGFKLQLRALSTEENNQIAITQPKQYDMFDGEYFSLPLVFPSGNLQPIEVKRIKNWDKIVPYFTTGKFDSSSRVNDSQGTAPFKVMYVKDKDSKEFSTTPTDWATLIPFQYNADTLGYRPDLTGKKIESWAELLDSKFKGKTALLDIPSIGIMDAAMVLEAAGMMKFGDKGNMTKEELDKVAQMLVKLKKDGQFRAFWKTFDESVNLMSSGEVALQSMWSPAVTAVKAKGIQCTYAPLKEGYRGWGGGIGLSRNLSGIALDAAYEYLNWMLNGWVGAFLGRQGYYSAAPETARKFMKAEEWDYWYEGKPAAIDIVDPFGKKIDSKGAIRDGGSFKDRFSNIVCWNSVMKEQTYLVQKWNEFVAA
ncbi:MAG: extracellular solute-binding protein [Leptolyngbya sp. UWPOB_LEPTO1]|uniref:ABC transporter substrate-binding protein n=1 Tax=Leptolyngbya sp. UWPOB_LEPTO1 TaxID=2815653 RepID=UPI001ACA00C1|nr:extracellular solute-binding protein [Leptolyngbya sp. UWPOB_LEPTO1]MBN8564387.1 extracellular solute-binding protein [Leptolyngbya sp. UWPOB_LEPTO1]